ncbi:MAG: Cna B-type domain-containing protein, partial [Coprococcus sp.]|nr:Cna B-type domain-containing protein [Coprococcus sp.]
MKKSTKALLALLMSVVMITTLILPNYSWSDAADKRGKDNLATAGDAELSLAASVEQLNVLNLNLEKMISSHPETWSDIQTGEPIPNGTAIRLSFDWSVDNTADTVEEDVVVSYDLNLFGFKLDNITTGKVYFSDSTGKEMGTYTIVDGIFTVTINKDYYNANSEKKGKATLNGVIDVDQTGNEGSKDATLSAGGQTWPITITYDKKESVVSVSKTLGGDLTKTPDGNYIQPYTVTVGCQYDKITELNLTDAHGNAITSLGSFEYNGNTYDSLDALVAAATNSGAMDAGESFTFTYNAIVSKDCYAQESNDNDISNTLTATYKSNFDKPDESSSSSSTAKINRNKPNINKNGVLSEDGTEVTWTITIDCGDFTWDDVDLSEAIDTYTEGISGGETLTKTFTKDDFTTSDNRYYSTTYTTTISDTAAGSVTPVNVKNTYEKVKVDGNNYSGNATVTTNGASFVNKECVDQYKDSDGNKILVWETYLDIPDTEITNLHISDSIPWSWNSTHVLSGYNGFASTISIDGTNVFTWENDALKLLDTNNEIVTGNYYGVGDGFNIYLTDSYVAAHKNSRIVVRYETIVDSGPTAGKTFENKVSVGYNESPKAFEDTGSWTDHSINILSKWGEKNEDMDTVQYAVRAYFYEMKDRLKPGTVVLTDKFSNDYMEIVSLDDAYICSDLNPYYASSDVDVTSAVSMSKKQDGSVTFTTSLTQEQCDMMKEKGGLIIHYTARIKDPLKTTENISFTNTITGEFDGTSIGEQSMTNELTPNDIVTKAVAEYSADSAPNIKFTIKVNPTAADLVAGDTITAVDTMGSKLVFTSDNTISVTDTNTGQNVPFTYEYDQPNGRFIFTLPDETSLDITYTAKLTTIATDKQNPANNEQLTFENSGNTFSLEGQASDDTKDYYSEQRFSYVPNVSGTGTVSSLTLYKYYTKPDGSSATIGGSTFEVYETVRNGDTFSIDESKLFASKTLDADVNEWQITDLKLDTVYALKETGAANGFKVNKDITYFTIPGSNASSVPASVKEFAPNSIYNYKNEYNTGSLQVSKTLAGSALTPEDSDTEFEFTITLSGTADSGITAEDVTAEYSGVKFVKGVATIKLKGGESKTIDGIPQGLTYSVAETAVDEFTSSSTGATDKIGNGTTKTAAFTNTKGEVATVDISVTKVWEDDNNKYNTRPASIQVQLKANGIEKGDPITLNQADNNWTYTWTALPEEEAGSKITYTVEEVGTVNGYTAAVTGNATTGFTITNTLNKQYEDGEVTFKIQKYATGTTTPVVGAVFSITDKDGAKITATTGNDGIASFTVQPSGNADIIYTLAEDSAPAGYEKTDTTWTVTVKKDGTVTVKEQDADPLVLVY